VCVSHCVCLTMFVCLTQCCVSPQCLCSCVSHSDEKSPLIAPPLCKENMISSATKDFDDLKANVGYELYFVNNEVWIYVVHTPDGSPTVESWYKVQPDTTKKKDKDLFDKVMENGTLDIQSTSNGVEGCVVENGEPGRRVTSTRDNILGILVRCLQEETLNNSSKSVVNGVLNVKISFAGRMWGTCIKLLLKKALPPETELQDTKDAEDPMLLHAEERSAANHRPKNGCTIVVTCAPQSPASPEALHQKA